MKNIIEREVDGILTDILDDYKKERAIDKNDIYNIWEERVKQVLETNGMNLNNNAALINSMFECARKHIDVD